MKILIAIFLVMAAATSAKATTISCEGENGYTVSSVPGKREPWSMVTVKKNGEIIADDLMSNGFYIQPDEVTGNLDEVVRATAIKNGIISSLILTIYLHDDGSDAGTGNAVIYDGTNTTVVTGLHCETP